MVDVFCCRDSESPSPLLVHCSAGVGRTGGSAHKLLKGMSHETRMDYSGTAGLTLFLRRACDVYETMSTVVIFQNIYSVFIYFLFILFFKFFRRRYNVT